MDSSALTTIGIIFAIYLLSRVFRTTLVTYQLKHIPTVGSSVPILSYYDAYRYLRHGNEMIQEGYQKYPGSTFKIATPSHWLVIVSGAEMLDDIRTANDNELSLEEAAADILQIDYTLGRTIRLDPYHIGVVRTPLTRNLAIRFSDVRDEILTAFCELVPATDEWKTVPALKTAMKIVCRTSNRLFVGLPLCRNLEYLELNEQFTIDVILGAQVINMFPDIIKPLIGRFFTKVPGRIKRTIALTESFLQAQIDQHGEQDKDSSDEHQNNFIKWLLDEADGDQERRTIPSLAVRLLAVNFAAVHTTTMALTDVLYDLATYPQYTQPMREEVEAVIAAEGWTKVSMGKMRKVDSFIKESQRMAVHSAGVTRKVLKDFTFSNGIFVPAGTTVSFASRPTHMDKEIYERSNEFQGFRFADMRLEEGESIKHQTVALSPDYITFGTGRHACPGRFFAVNEIKAILGHVLLNYDLKFAKAGPRPKPFLFAGSVSPNRTAELMFRKRVA